MGINCIIFALIKYLYMQIYKLIPKKSKIPNKEFSSWLHEAFIDPLSKLGYQCKTIASTPDNEDINCHILIFDWDQKTPWTQEELQSICVQDDDSQPYSKYSLYFGTLWVFIPYCP